MGEAVEPARLFADMERMGIGVEVTLAGGVAPAPAELLAPTAISVARHLPESDWHPAI